VLKRCALLVPLALLAACGEQATTALAPELRDPAVVGAINDPIMVDPDLASQNRPSAALEGGGPASATIPLLKRRAEEVAAAKAEAQKLLGKEIPPAPAPASGNGDAVSPESLGLAAAVLSGEGKRCAAKLGYTAHWATKLPAALPIYPRGHVQEAAGNDLDGCKLRAVNFLTPVAGEDVAAFYHAWLGKSGAAPVLRLDGADTVLTASKGGVRFLVYVRKTPEGLTEVDLVTG
jgi:hypothetical protein